MKEATIQHLTVILVALKVCLSSTRDKRRAPNGTVCFKNSDCMSDCCIFRGNIALCTGRPHVGQICGLFRRPPQLGANFMHPYMYTGSVYTPNMMNNNFNGFGRSPFSGFPMGPAGPRVLLAGAAPSTRGIATTEDEELEDSETNKDILPKDEPAMALKRISGTKPSPYPQDPTIAAYQDAGGYGTFGIEPNYFGLAP